MAGKRHRLFMRQDLADTMEKSKFKDCMLK